MIKKTLSFVFIAALALAPAGLRAQTTDGKAAFQKLKGLAGTWTGPIGSATGPKGRITYEVISGGSVVMEVLFPGEPHEMRTLYHLDKGDLVMTHYCSGGNQPHMRLSPTASTPDKLVFDFDGGTNLDVAKDSFIHNGEIRFLADGRVEASWTFWANGKAAGANHFFALTREK
ncbi:MAG: hypothetical protein K1Y01_10400 [Vicinamibacteria bacterium]|nr:hypothetical protein [Vicinamibacteria bacterium]